MAEARSENARYRFMIRVERKWKLWIPLIVAVAYFAAVMAIVMARVDLGIPQQERMLVLGGLGLFAFLFLWELLLLPKFKVREKKQKKARKNARAAQAAPQVLETEPDAPVDENAQYARPSGIVDAPVEAPPAPAHDDAELALTGDERNGRTVLEVSMPPKSLHRGAIYSKAFITVDDAFTLRVEDLVATPEELRG